ncbi:MAG: hypothetical protein IKJ19_06955 [Clostridia bacterium]|nr:hypothetical protein [Clostridia bacterium]
MKVQENLQVKEGKKKSKVQEPSLDDVILLLISIFTENDIKNQVSGESSLLLKFGSKLFELTINEKENING